MEKTTQGKCTSVSHHLLKENAKNRLNDLQLRFSDLQAARKEGRITEVAMLEEQVYQSLREWKTELDVPTPASSFLGGSLGSFSDDIGRILQLCEEEDDATSVERLVLKPDPDPGPAPPLQSLNLGNVTAFQEDYVMNSDTRGLFQGFDPSKGSSSDLQNTVVNTADINAFSEYDQFILDEGFNHGLSYDTKGTEECGKNAETNDLSYISPPPSAFMGPTCALWDCTRPSQGSEWYEDYCSSFHATLALNEGTPGLTPVLRPMGIGLKDNSLFNALSAKKQGKNVGIPQCEGAAYTKSPWNATELFDLSLLEGETLREWLFFDKPRKAYDSGNRKQRSLPDYSGRGWHESRKLVMKEFEGQKRSYYMDPQPSGCYEWHLFEYEINGFDACALYRLELKLLDGKKTPKGKVTKDSLADLQKKMGRLTAEVTADSSPIVKGRTKAIKNNDAGNVDSPQDQKTSEF